MRGALLERARAQSSAGMHAFALEDLMSVPAPARRYLREVLALGQPLARRARLSQEGEFLLRPEPRGWRPFVARHELAVAPPAFTWTARIRVTRGIHVHVHDGFQNGRGSMRAHLMGLVPLVSAQDTPELRTAELQRYLAEAVQMPAALLPRHGVFWEAVDARCARAFLRAGTTTASLEFEFGDDGLVHGVYTPARYREVGGRLVPTPWRARFWGYERHGGMFVPREGEVGWLLPQGPQTYWRARVVRFEYDRRA